MTREIAYSQLDARALFRLYNDEAAARGLPKKPKCGERVDMAKDLALLLAQPKAKNAPPPAPTSARARRYSEVREAVIEELCKVDYFELAQTGQRVTVEEAAAFSRHLLISHGFSYAIVLQRVKKRLPKSKMKSEKLRVHATNIRSRKSGYEHARLPDRRPHSNKGVTRG